VEIEEERLLVCRVGELLGVLEAIEGPGPAVPPGVEDLEEGRP
jgi:hypothetical protein